MFYEICLSSADLLVSGKLNQAGNIPIKKLNDEGKECVVKKIEVRANATTTQLKFPVDNTNNSNRLNGASQVEQSTVLLSYDLTEYSDQVADAEVGDTYTIDAKTGDVATVANSVLAGRFVILYASAVTGETNTLTVALVGDEGDIRTWKIKIAGQNGGSYSGGDEYNYNILRNNFYSIGQKLKSDTTDPDPETPDDEDDPIDLSQDNDVIIILNDAWDVIYDMGLGD